MVHRQIRGLRAN